jgi:uncharacterized SAM-binding protein YcdF (DUF218 family)
MYRVLVDLLQPFPLLMAAVGLGLLCLWWFRPERSVIRRWIWVSYGLLLLDSFPATAWVTTHWLEGTFPRRVTRPEGTQVLVVLTGGLIPSSEPGGAPDLEEGTLRRLIKVAELYRQGPACPILVSGGRPSGDRSIPAEADLAANTLEQWGIPASDVFRETESRNTFENARESARWLRERGLTEGIVLVTSAKHLWRADLFFRSQGLTVTPMGCHYRSDEIDSGWRLFWPKSSAVRSNQEMLHEVLGVMYAGLRGQLRLGIQPQAPAAPPATATPTTPTTSATETTPTPPANSATDSATGAASSRPAALPFPESLPDTPTPVEPAPAEPAPAEPRTVP